MKSSKQVLIAIIAVLIMLMPTTSLAVAFSGIENVQGGGTDPITNPDDLIDALKSDVVLITISGEITVNKVLSVNNTHVLSGGTIKRDSNYIGALLDIKLGATLTIDGVTINGNDVHECNSLVTVNGGTFIMKGNSVMNNYYAKENGGAVTVNSGTFEMSGGRIGDTEISPDTIRAKSGGAVYVSKGAFHMTGGTISGNTVSNRGGGVEITGLNSSFIMSGGEIINNIAKNGGGVRIDLGASFTMSGGTISNNIATSTEANNGNGGGVAIGSASFSMTDGLITNNKAICRESTGWGAGIFLLTNDSKNGTMFTMSGGTISNNGQFNNDGGISGDGRELYLRDVGCITIINGGRILEKWGENNSNQITVTGSSIYMSGNNPVTFTTIVSEANPFSIGGNTDDIEGTVQIDPKIIVTIMNNIHTNENGMTASFTVSGNVINRILSSSDFKNYDSTFNVITIDTDTDVYINCKSGDDNNTGDSDNPVKSLKKAFEHLEFADLTGKSVAIHVLYGPIKIDAGKTITIKNDRAYFDGDEIIIFANNVTIVKSYSGVLFSVSGELSLDYVTLGGVNTSGVLIDAKDNSIVQINTHAELTGNNDTAVKISGNAKVTLNGKITNCKTSPSDNGGAFFMNGGILNMESGEISGCGAKYGAAVRMESSSCKFYMSGGEIKNNKAYDNGSAVSAKEGCEFIMSGGEIKNNVNGETGMSLSSAELMSAVQVLYGSTFMISGGSITNNTTLGSKNCQIYTLYGGNVIISGGTIRDVENVKDATIIVKNSAQDNMYASISIDSNYDGTIKVVNYTNTMVQTIINNPAANAGSLSLLYPKVTSGYTANMSFEITDNDHYLNYVYNPKQGETRTIDGSISRSYNYSNTEITTTITSTLTLNWGSFHMVQFEEGTSEDDQSNDGFIVNKIHKEIPERIFPGNYVASCDEIKVTVDKLNPSESVYMNGIMHSFTVSDTDKTVLMTVPTGIEMLYIVLDTGALSVTVSEIEETEFGSTPSEITVKMCIARENTVITVTSWSVTDNFTFVNPPDSIMVSGEVEELTILPSDKLVAGKYTVEVKLYETIEDGTIGIVGYVCFDYTVVDPDLHLDVKYNNNLIRDDETILYIVGTETFTLEIETDAPIEFIGINTILPINDELDIVNTNSVIITFDLDGTATGSFYLDLFVCSENASAERGFFLNILPSMEFLTEPSV